MNMRFFMPLLLAALFMAMPKAHASRGIDRATGQALWDAAVNGKTTTIGTGGGALKVIGPSGTKAQSASGGVTVADAVKAPVAGKEVPVTVTAEVPKSAIVEAVAGCFTGGLVGCVIGVATPIALAYVANNGLRLNPVTGVPEYTDPKICTMSPCYKFWFSSDSAPQSTQAWYLDDAAANWTAYRNTLNDANRAQLNSCNQTTFACSWTFYNKTTGAKAFDFSQTAVRSNATPASPTWYPATPQNVKDNLYRNNPPVGVIDELSRYGNINWPNATPTVSGPASIDGPKTVTNKPDGSKETRQERTDYSYDGPTVTRKGTTTVTTTTGPDGTTVTSTTTSTTTDTSVDAPQQSEEEAAPEDTPLPEVPDLYQRKYPDGMEGIWNEKKAELMQSPLMQLKDQLLPTNIGSTGTCPVLTIDLTFASWAGYGAHDFAPPCWVWDFGKVVTILSALFLARALIFGG